jgi:hypothetical protein
MREEIGGKARYVSTAPFSWHFNSSRQKSRSYRFDLLSEVAPRGFACFHGSATGSAVLEQLAFSFPSIFPAMVEQPQKPKSTIGETRQCTVSPDYKLP